MSILNLICCRPCPWSNSQVIDFFHCSIIPLYSLMCTIISDEIALCVNLRFSVVYGILPLLLLRCTTDKHLSSSLSLSVPSITLLTHTCCHLDSHLPLHTHQLFQINKAITFPNVHYTSMFSSHKQYLNAKDFHPSFASTSTPPNLSPSIISL